MKIVTTMIATALLSVSAMAYTAVHHDYDGALRGIALNNACITATTVQSISATKNCAKLVPVQTVDQGMTHTDWVCAKWETSSVSYPRAFNRTVCTAYANVDQNQVCTQWAEQADFLPATIKTLTVTEDGEFSNYPGVAGTHTFPSCQ